MKVEKNKVGQTRWTTDAGVVDLVRVLARQLPDNTIAAILNRSGKTTAHGASWTRTHVRSHETRTGSLFIAKANALSAGELTLDEAAETLKVSRATAYRMVTNGVIPVAAAVRWGALDNPAR